MNNLQVIHGEAIEELTKMGTNSFDYAFTSPPYNRKRNDKYAHYDDSVDWLRLLTLTTNKMMRVAKNHVFVNIQKNYYNKEEYFKFLGEFAPYIVEEIIWTKSNPMPASSLNITNAYEVFVVLHAQAKPLKGLSTYTTNVVSTPVYSKNPYKGVHNAVMNPMVAKEMFARFIPEGSSVIDPFAGTGTTLDATAENKGAFTGIELQKEYVSIIQEKINSYDLQTLLGE